MPSLEVDGGASTPTPRSIRRAARFGLYRALNVRRVVGFVGTGVTVSYGRLAWNQLVDEVWAHIDKRASDFIKAATKDERDAADAPGASREAFKSVREIHGALVALAKRRAKSLSAEDSNPEIAEGNVLILELCERLERELDEIGAPGAYREGQVETGLRSLVKDLVRDDRSYARRNLEARIQAIGRYLKLARVPKDASDAQKARAVYLRAVIKGQSGDGGPSGEANFSHRFFYNEELLEALGEFLRKHGHGLEASLCALFLKECETGAAMVGPGKPGQAAGAPGDGPIFFTATASEVAGLERTRGRVGEAPETIQVLPPDRRSFLAIALAAATQAVNSAPKKRRNTLRKEFRSIILDAMRFAEPEQERLRLPGDRDHRGNMLEFARPVIDPIHSIFSTLQIRRFLTTNYDLELERYLEHNDFMLGDFTDTAEVDADAFGDDASSVLGRRSRIGKLAKSSVFDPKAAAKLVAFAVGAPGVHVDIFHLHGRVQPGDPLVITEGDYQQAYLKNDESRRIFNEALDVIFGGNPVLFLGAGLSEADLMRPLRQFVSNRSGPAGRPVFALMPALTDASGREVETLRYKLRYGVHAIHFGCHPSDDEPRHEKELYERSHPLSVFIKQHCDEAREVCPRINEISELHHEIRALRGLSSVVRDAAATPDLAKFNNGLSEAFKDLPPSAKAHPFRDVGEIDTTDMAEVFKVYRPWMLRAFPRLSQLRVDRVAFAYIVHRLFAAGARGDVASFLNPTRGVLLSDFLDRLREKVITLSLDQELEYIGASWRDWWKQWRELPPARIAEASRVKRPGSDDLRDTVRHVLHLGQGTELDPREGRIFDTRLGLQARLEPFASSWREAVKQSPDHEERYVAIAECPLGGGKGLFFEQLRRFSGWRNLELPGHLSAYPAYNDVFFANTTFACEYASIIDGLIQFLEAAMPSAAVQDSDDAQAARAPRIIRLRALFKNLRLPRSGDREQRAAVVINNVDMLVDHNGRPYTGEIRDFLSILINESPQSPIDVILLTRNGRLDALLRSLGRCGENDKQRRASDHTRLSKHELGPVQFGALDEGPEGGLFQAYRKALESNSDRLLAHADPDTRAGEISKTLQKRGDQLERIYKATGDCLFTQSIILAATANTTRDIEALLNWYDELDHIASVRRPSQAVDEIVDRTIECYTNEAQTPDKPQERARNALENAILRHMAFLSVPVELEVLRDSPDISRLFATYANAWDGPGHRIILNKHKLNQLMVKAISRLVRRGLVVRIHGRQETPDRDRYALHRRMRGYILRRQGSMESEPSESHFFDISTFVAQPREMPTLDNEQYQFLSQLVRKLSEPDFIDGREGAAEASGKLRAAQGVVRSLFSLTVLSRIGDLEDFDEAGETVLSAHVTRLRRLLTRAGDWGEKYRKLPLDKRPAPLYRDEIVWLLNERGLASLAQGRLHDAVPLFRRAAEENRQIESSKGGSASARLQLNLAHAQIELGRIDGGLASVREIMRMENNRTIPDKEYKSGDEDDLSETLKRPYRSHVLDAAVGYRGWIDHLTGRPERARVRFKEAIDGLSRANRSRGVSMFSAVLAELDLFEGDHDAARANIRRAKAAAEAGRHVDLLYSAHLTEIQMSHLLGESGPALLSRLDAVLSYARRCGLYALEARASVVYGAVLLSHGDSKLSGEFAVRALALTADNGMVLRMIDAMILMAAVTLARGRRNQGLDLLSFAAQWAARSHYQLAVERALNLAAQARETPRFDFSKIDRTLLMF